MSFSSGKTSRGTDRPASAISAVAITRPNSLVTHSSIRSSRISSQRRRACSRPSSVSGTGTATSPLIALRTLYSLSAWRARIASSIDAEEPPRVVGDEHPHLPFGHARLEQPRADLAERVRRVGVVRLAEAGAERRVLRADPADPVDEGVDLPVVEARLLVVHAERVLDQRTELDHPLDLVLRGLDDEVRVVDDHAADARVARGLEHGEDRARRHVAGGEDRVGLRDHAQDLAHLGPQLVAAVDEDVDRLLR